MLSPRSLGTVNISGGRFLPLNFPTQSFRQPVVTSRREYPPRSDFRLS